MRKYEYSNELVNLVKKFLVDDEWHFSFDENTGVFDFGLRVKIQKINCFLQVFFCNFCRKTLAKKNSIENIIIEHDKWDELMDGIDKAIGKFAQTPKPYALDVLSCDIASVLIDMNEEYSYDYEFVNKELVKEIITHDTIPKGKDIAASYDISPQALSMAYSRLVKKIQQAISHKYMNEAQIQR